MRTTNIMIIGVGLHAQRIYLPILFKFKTQLNLNIWGVDLKEKAPLIKEYLKVKAFKVPLLLLDHFKEAHIMPTDVVAYLNAFVVQNNIDGVLISTEPLAHKAYAEWALKQGLHILMDKPISTRKGVVYNIHDAIGLIDDYTELQQLYNKHQKTKKTIFSIAVHRRYHIGFQKVISLIKEVALRFDAPVTSIQSTHSDGQWRMPNEILNELYHSFCQGYGVCSHSGYHFFDLLFQFYQAGYIKEKTADTVEAMSSFMLPSGFLKQFTEKNYISYFGEEYRESNPFNDTSLHDLFKNFGEIDAFLTYRFLRDGDTICNASLNLLHNSFTRRTWLKPAKDLYKGNGRVKHENHIIQQGPFQSIQIHSYQAHDKHDKNTEQDYLIGGNNHFDINVFRNAEIFGKHETPLKTYRISDIDLNNNYSETELTHETAKEMMVLEFIYFIKGRIKKDQLLSNIDQHQVPVKIMSAAYQSHIQQTQDLSPLIYFTI